jgi:hypothetical protein
MTFFEGLTEAFPSARVSNWRDDQTLAIRRYGKGSFRIDIKEI